MLTDRDLPTLHAAASALRHAPPAMRAAHLAERLEEMAERVVKQCVTTDATGKDCLQVGGDNER